MRVAIIVILLLAALLLPACNLTTEERLPTPTPTVQASGKPTVAINSPPNGQSVRQGEEVLISATAADTVGVTRVQLFANNQPVKTVSSENPSGDRQKNYVLDYTPVTRGEVVLRVVAYRVTVASDPAEIRINVTGGSTIVTSTSTGGGGVPGPGPIVTSAPTLDPNDPTCRVQTTSALNMRSQPTTTNNNIITTLPSGAIAQVIGRLGDNSWWQVRYNFSIGWVSAAFTNVYGSLCSTVPIVPIQTIITPTLFTPSVTPSPTPTATPTATATQGFPDLQITNFAGPEEVTLGLGSSTVIFNANVANTGAGRADNFTVRVRVTPADPSVPPVESIVGTLRPGEVIVLPFEVTFTSPGTFIVEVLADSNNTVNEPNEANNRAQLVVEVVLPL